MWCPSCGAEYRPGFTRCTDCDVDLVDELPVVPEAKGAVDPVRALTMEGEHLGPELEQAYSGSRVDTELIRSVLEGSGIESVLWGTGSAYPPETGAKLSAVRVMVRPSDLDRAREVIDAAGVGELDLDLDLEGEWDQWASGGAPPEMRASGEPAASEPSESDWDDDLEESDFAGPWYSRPWGQLVMGLIALFLVVAMIATYALE
jgi:Putative prokaryotic signal transducing protein